MTQVNLWCAVLGRNTVFSVAIDLCEDVSTLQEAVANTLSTRARLVRLFLARKDGVWLKRSHVEVSQGVVQNSLTRMNLAMALSNEECFGEDFKPRHDEIHVLVEVMKEKKRMSPEEWSELSDLIFRQVFIDGLTSTPRGSSQFKTELRAAYNGDMGGRLLRCMLLDTALPCSLVVTAHLFRQCNAHLCEKLMSFSNIDDSRNGLLLFEPIKLAFHKFQISFIYDQSTDKFSMMIFDPSLRPLRVVESLNKTQQSKLPRDFEMSTTFGDLEGRTLCFRSDQRPFKRCLNLQARLARKLALEKCWIRPGEGKFDDFWGENMWIKHCKFFFPEEPFQ